MDIREQQMERQPLNRHECRMIVDVVCQLVSAELASNSTEGKALYRELLREVVLSAVRAPFLCAVTIPQGGEG